MTVAVLLCSLAASAYDFEVEGIYYNITSEEELTVEVTNKNDVWDDSYSGDIVVPPSVNYNNKIYAVTRIGEEAFICRVNPVTSVTLPEGILSIGDNAFSHCGISSITLPESLVEIGYGVFQSSDLISVVIPKNVQSIGIGIFYNFNNLTSIMVDKDNAFYDSRGNCNAIIETAHKTLWQGCAATVIPEGIVYIGISAFDGCGSLTNITIPQSVEYIHEYAFARTGLTSIAIPKSVRYISQSVFEYSTNLESIVVEDGNTYYDSREGCNAIIETATNTLLYGCATTKIPQGVTSIGYGAFVGMSSLPFITIPEGIVSIGNEAFRSCSGLTSVIIPEGVVSIGGSAFLGCENLSSIKLPNSLESLGYNVFGENDSYTQTAWYKRQKDGVLYLDDWVVGYKGKIPENTTITIKEGVKGIADFAFGSSWSDTVRIVAVVLPESLKFTGFGTFQDCVNLTSATLPKDLAEIGQQLFYGCKSLTSVNIPDDLTRIGHRAFSDCVSLSDVSIPESVTSVGSDAFYNTAWYSSQEDGIVYLDNWVVGYKGEMPEQTSVNIKDEVKGMSDYAFDYNDKLASITLPRSLKWIGVDAFDYCSSLSEVRISDLEAWCAIDFASSYSNPLIYAENLYLNGELVSNLTIPNTVTELKNYAFSGGHCFASISIPSSVTSIGDYAFWLCDSVKSLALPQGVKSIGDCAFLRCYGLENITLPNSIEHIGEYAFQNCTSLSSLVIPESLMSISEYSFSRCQSLSNVKISSGVKNIGEGAFWDCVNLSSVTLGKDVECIGEYAFNNCIALSEMHSYAIAAPQVQGNYVFDGIDKNICTLNVPVGSKNGYETAHGWKDFRNIIEKSDLTSIDNLNTSDTSNTFAPIFNIKGQKMSESRDNLPAGVYIQNGKKFVVM